MPDEQNQEQGSVAIPPGPPATNAPIAPIAQVYPVDEKPTFKHVQLSPNRPSGTFPGQGQFTLTHGTRYSADQFEEKQLARLIKRGVLIEYKPLAE